MRMPRRDATPQPPFQHDGPSPYPNCNPDTRIASSLNGIVSSIPLDTACPVCRARHIPAACRPQQSHPQPNKTLAVISRPQMQPRGSCAPQDFAYADEEILHLAPA